MNILPLTSFYLFNPQTNHSNPNYLSHGQNVVCTNYDGVVVQWLTMANSTVLVGEHS